VTTKLPREIVEKKVRLKPKLYCDILEFKNRHNRSMRRLGQGNDRGLTFNGIVEQALKDWLESARSGEQGELQLTTTSGISSNEHP
jgi:hypothetical protein